MPYPYLFKDDTTQTNIVAGGYCRAEDVQAIFKNISAYSSLDVAEINRRIADATVEIDRTLEVAYVVPISGDTNALTLLRLVCSRLTAAIIHEVYYREGQPGQVVPGEMWRSYAEMLLKDVIDGVMTFFVATPQSGGEKTQFPIGKGASFNPDNDQDVNFRQQPLFQRGSRGNLSSLGDLI